MWFRHLLYFVRVAEAGGIAAGARKLRISQPALSVRIKELECEIRAPLLERSAQGVMLTPAGRKLLPYAQEAIRAYEAALRAAPFRSEGLSISIGVNPTLGSVIVPIFLRKCSHLRADVQLNVQQASSRVLIERVSSGELDAALAYEVPRNSRLERFALFTEELELIGPAGVLAGLPPQLNAGQLGQLALVLDPRGHALRELIETAMSRSKSHLRISVEVEPLHAKLELIRSAGCCALGPRYLYRDGIAHGEFAVRRLKSPPVDATVTLVTRPQFDREIRRLLVAALQGATEDCLGDPAFRWRLPGGRRVRVNP
ncbi:LysR family transcriptional regulator [Roseiarcaceae bacterium H3SJ34-1]|uniref:LysR family transcriptional regulator n=1 Tax=Terripilifer ovatus TaxID=3032367 RepID=UPI003AB92651|nr:LysR family transcriptional regulator [Roseiarcaceae bacterium H3SJ34-1]